MTVMHNVSPLMDGELDGDEAVREIARLKAGAELRESWDTYHLIGDAMRKDNVDALGFSARFSDRLAQEPTVLAPHASAVVRKPRAFAMAASIAVFAVAGWLTFNAMKPDSVSGKLAEVQPQGNVQQASAVAEDKVLVPVPVVAGSAQHAQEYLLAHQGISPSTAFQGVTPYIRTVSISGH